MVDNMTSREEIAAKAVMLRNMYEKGPLGGEAMPEDANPGLPKGSALNYLYFTLPMALNYQRNSYMLWKSALQSYMDVATAGIYDPHYVASIAEGTLREMLTKYKVRASACKAMRGLDDIMPHLRSPF